MGYGREKRGSVGLYLVTLLSLLGIAISPKGAGAVTLGDALAFSALSSQGDVNINNVAKVSVNALGAVGGQAVTLGSNSLAGGDAIANPGNIKLGNFSKVKGTCITNGGTEILGTGASCFLSDNTGTNPKLAVMTQAATDVSTFETALLGAPTTQVLGPVNLAAGKKLTISNTVAGLNIIELPSLTLGNSSTLTLAGVAGDSTVLKITGDLKIGSGAKIVLSGGLPVGQVLIYTGGNVLAWGNSTSVGATLLATNSACAVGSGAQITGAILCRNDVTFLQNATLTFNPSLVDIPGPIVPITLGGAIPFLLVSTGGDSILGNVTLTLPAAPNSGAIGGNSDKFGNNSIIEGNVVASNTAGVGISLGNFTKVKQGCITGGSTILLGTGSSCASTDTTGTDPLLTSLANSSADASSFSASVAALAPDLTIPAINIPASGTQTLTCSGAPIRPPTTVVNTPSITMGGSSTLKINCPAGSIMAINLTGTGVTPGALNLGPGFKITLTGGITANSVVFNAQGTSATAALVGGSSSIFNGTLVAAARPCNVSTGAQFNGQIVCGKNVTTNNFKATYLPLVPIP